ncbi:FAD-dependent oxidoreductase [Prauserella cavernicola]|uniref:FAD-dependent oxidoreductase n=1 Tax=Prauserella cavernicola TaxID=2800127 RepID=A0A934V5K8_9PSEU|nr:FAD-dependent oxidoreductase [Prauserella cavernicola]MBK1786612.1 FAD-dependent oxidoreductase [Prauserella cavernicola]
MGQPRRVCIVGGGPAGMVAGVLLARAGVEVVVVEKYPDFHRDFRGDTIHPSTLEVMHELGWLTEFLRLPHDTMETVQVAFGRRRITVADFTRLPVHSPYIAFVPQWDFLSFLADRAAHLPRFTLRRDTEVTGLVYEHGCVAGVRARSGTDTVRIDADLVIGADGRHSITRQAAGLRLTESAAPVDVFWLHIPRHPGEQTPLFTGGHGSLISIDRGDYWQLAYAFPRGTGETLRARGLDALRSRITSLQPAYADRIEAITDWADVHELTVRVDRLRRWHRPGLLCIGDAAHAMSPAGGVGINLAVQDAVATANILGPILRDRVPTPAELDRVRRRRAWPARVTQLFQTHLIRGLYHDASPATVRPPVMLRLFSRLPVLRQLAGRFVGLGLRPERPENTEHQLD